MESKGVLRTNASGERFLAGGGEMGHLTREFDWAATPVGPVSSWKASLRTTVSIVLHSKFPMLLWWGEELIQFYNDSFRPSLGSEGKHPTALGQKGEDCWPETWPVISPLIDQVRCGGESVFSEEQLIPIFRNGKMEDVYWTFSYSPVIDEKGEVGGVLVVCNEITEKLFGNDPFTEKETAHWVTGQAEEKALLAIQSADLGTYEIDLVTDEMITSPRFNAIWGMSHAFPRSMIVGFIHPDDRALRQQAHEDSVKTGRLHYEARVVWEDQSAHWVRVKGKVLYNAAGDAVMLIGVIQDITEQKLFAESLKSQVRERTLALQRSNDDLLQFAHVISHDLKEPVRKVRLFSSRIRSEMSDLLPEKGKGYLDKVQNATDRMFSMIEGVLSYSELSSADRPMDRIHLNEVIGNIQSDLEVIIQQKKVRVISDDLPVIRGAAVLIYQLFYNLINNSLKFSRNDLDPVISISSSLIHEDGREMAQIVISDNGIGFEQVNAERIFDPFARLNSKDKFEGTGLGLALCKKIVLRHGGNISATGVKNEGATFTISLPLQQVNKNL